MRGLSKRDLHLMQSHGKALSWTKDIDPRPLEWRDSRLIKNLILDFLVSGDDHSFGSSFQVPSLCSMRSDSTCPVVKNGNVEPFFQQIEKGFPSPRGKEWLR